MSHTACAQLSFRQDDDYDDDYRQPTSDSVARGKDFLAETLQEMRGEFPVADAVPDGDGGFRLYWIRPGRNVQLNVPSTSDKPLSLFWRDGVDHALHQEPSPSELAKRLTWLVSCPESSQ